MAEPGWLESGVENLWRVPERGAGKDREPWRDTGGGGLAECTGEGREPERYALLPLCCTERHGAVELILCAVPRWKHLLLLGAVLSADQEKSQLPRITRKSVEEAFCRAVNLSLAVSHDNGFDGIPPPPSIAAEALANGYRQSWKQTSLVWCYPTLCAASPVEHWCS
jgi:hypothetical protein